MTKPSSTNDLIRKLGKASPVVRPLPPSGALLAVWVVPMAVVLAAVLAFRGLRPDLGTLVQSPLFVTAMVGSLGAMLAGSWLSVKLAVPRWPLPALWVAVGRVTGSLALISAVALWALADHDHALLAAGNIYDSCITTVLAVMLAGGLVMALVLRRAMSSEPRRLAVMLALALGSAGVLAISLTCPAQAWGHIFLSHILPALMGCLGFIPIISAWLNKHWS